MRRDLITAVDRRRRLHGRCSASSTRSSITGIAPGRVPRQRQRLADPAWTASSSARSCIGQDFAEPVLDKNGKPKDDDDGNPVTEPDPRTSSRGRRRRGYNAAAARTSPTAGPTSTAPATLHGATSTTYLALEQPYDPGLTAGAGARSTRSPPRPRASTRTSRRPTRASRHTAIAAVRRLPLDARPNALIDDNTDGRCLGLLGEPGVNVLELNLALDKEAPASHDRPQTSAPRCSAPRSCARRSSDRCVKLDPRVQVRNPVMFVVEIGAVITTVTWLIQVFGGKPLGGGHEPAWFTFTVAFWLWLTVVFANLAEALAEGRGRAQADTLRAMRTETVARLRDGDDEARLRAAPRRRRGRRGRRADPRRRHGDRGHRHGRRVGDHGRVRARDPRVRRRPQRGHRRHARALATASWSRSPRSPASRSWTA